MGRKRASAVGSGNGKQTARMRKTHHVLSSELLINFRKPKMLDNLTYLWHRAESKKRVNGLAAAN
jgi:hypothetical protein